MARIEKLVASFRDCRSEFRYVDFVKIVAMLGYAQLRSGKTSGSRRKFHRAVEPTDLIMLDEPHDGMMKRGMVQRLQKQLQEKGFL